MRSLNKKSSINDLSDSDQLLWQRFKKGCTRSFEIIYKRYYNQLFNYGKRISRRSEIVEDNIQELFVELWNSRERLNSPESVKFYLLRSLRFKLIKEEKKMKSFVGEELFPNTFLQSQLSLLEEKENEELDLVYGKEEKVISAISRLSSRQKEAIYLRYYNLQSIEEISQIMNMNYQSVKNLIHRALNTIRGKSLVEFVLIVFACIF